MADSLSEETAGNGAGPAAPDDAEHLRAEIAATRQRLGETVEQLAAKVDVKSRARAQAAQLAGRVKGTAGQASGTVRKAAAQGAGKARDYRVPLAAGAAGTGALVVICLVIWQRRRR